ncbi:MAG TPA: ABC transporter substrate-binding protein [Methylomirabilota bacterium]|jgi:peptide/nickel transport system substrate-binding protein
MTTTARLVFTTTLIGTLLGTAAITPATAESPRRGGVFRVPVADAASLDPHQSAAFMTHVYASLVYSQLVRFPSGPETRGAGDHRILPDLAERWEFVTPTTVVFTLRKGVRFHRKPPVNGREVTAEDVKYSLERFRAKSPLRARLEAVQSIDVLDRHTVRIVLREPFAPLLNHLANAAHCAIIPREVDERFKDLTHPDAVIGSGPFVLRAYDRGVRAVFDRNADFHLAGLPHLDGVVLEVVPDAASRLALLRAGKLELGHWWGYLSPEDGRSLRQPGMVVTPHMITDLAHIYMRTDQPPFNDVRVRRAVSLAIDRKAWRDTIHYGEGCLDSGPVPCGMSPWKLDASKLEAAGRKYVEGHDPAEARRLLAEAGFPRGLSAPVFHWPGFPPPWRSYFDLVADNLSRMGLNVELRAEELGKYMSTTALGKFEKMAMGPFGAGETEVDAFLYESFFSGSPRNRSRVADAELDRLLVAQRREMDPARRVEIVHEIQRYLADKSYYVYLPMWPRYIAHPTYVKGFRHIDGYSVGARLMHVWLER